MTTASKDNLIMIDPYTEPMDWVAVSSGGERLGMPIYTAAHEPNTGAIILQAL